MKITEKDIGRRVIVNGEVDGRIFDNEKGEIVKIMDYGEPPIGIRFDESKQWYHTCKGKTEGEHGWFVYERNITFEKEIKKMTGIRIETEKIVDSNGNLCRKITGFKALSQDKLPEKYVYGKSPVVYKRGNRLELKNIVKNGVVPDPAYMINEIVSEEEFQKLLEHCHKAGDHLMDVNRELARKKAEWNGTETFII